MVDFAPKMIKCERCHGDGVIIDKTVNTKNGYLEVICSRCHGEGWVQAFYKW